ncbi:MAG: hypothetical protein AAF692_00495, partial [Pseudomonadota bacterium]
EGEGEDGKDAQHAGSSGHKLVDHKLGKIPIVPQKKARWAKRPPRLSSPATQSRDDDRLVLALS